MKMNEKIKDAILPMSVADFVQFKDTKNIYSAISGAN
jgi:hypothetical protein